MLLDRRKLLYLSLGLGYPRVHERQSRLFPHLGRIDADGADDMALAACRAFIQPLNEIFLLIAGQCAFHEAAKRIELAAGGDPFPPVLGVHGTPHLTFAAPGAGGELDQLPTGQSRGDRVALYFVISGQ